MTTRALIALAILLLTISCSKDETKLPDLPHDNFSLLMTKRTFETTLADGQKIIDSFAYEYDDKGQITRYTYLNLGTYTQLEYSGDLISRATLYNSAGVKGPTQINIMRRVGDGNTILWDLSTKALNGGIDTVYFY